MRPLAFLVAAALLSACAGPRVRIDRGFDFSRVSRVAVLGFPDYPGRGGSGRLLRDALAQSLASAGYDVADPGRTEATLRRLGLGPLIGPNQARGVGRALGVDAVVLGRITDFAAAQSRVVNVAVETDRTEPVYGRRVRRVRGPDGRWRDADDEVVRGWRTTRVVQRGPRIYSDPGRLAVFVRMLDVRSGAALWSASDSIEGGALGEEAQDLADDVLKAVSSTWPAGGR
ncbi:MAG: hypothetical protein KGM24_05630 [Elusimicrobia bacterium]|nr:hypothetical protein [Elusimicrobiota bacterium]